LLCEATGSALMGSCATVSFDASDERRTAIGGDFDVGGVKGQCALDEYVAGMSLSSGTPHSLLCCTR
jgi:hypothetical protein